MHTICKNNHYDLTDAARQKAKEVIYCSITSKDDGFANGRFIRNIYEDAVLNHAKRVIKMKKPTIDELRLLTENDFTNKY